jgi:hypothetical protein
MGLSSQQKGAVEQLVRAAKKKKYQRERWAWLGFSRRKQTQTRFDAERKILDEFGGLRIKHREYSDYDLLFRPLVEPSLHPSILVGAERLLKQSVAVVARTVQGAQMLSVDEQGRVYHSDDVIGPSFGFIAENIEEAIYLELFDNLTMRARCFDCAVLSKFYGSPQPMISFVIPDDDTKNVIFYPDSVDCFEPLLTRPIPPIPPIIPISPYAYPRR